MNDWRNTAVMLGDRIVYVTLKGHKPVMHLARVNKVEPGRIRVEGMFASVGPEGKEVWLHQKENFIVVSSVDGDSTIYE